MDRTYACVHFWQGVAGGVVGKSAPQIFCLTCPLYLDEHQLPNRICLSTLPQIPQAEAYGRFLYQDNSIQRTPFHIPCLYAPLSLYSLIPTP